MKTQMAGLALALSVTAGAAAAQETLSLYNWGDYINPDVLTKFTEETGIAVTLDTYSSNEEMLAKIQAGATGYDIVFPSVHMNDIMLKLGLLEKTGINAHPDFKNIDPAFLRAKEDPASEYCLPYAWGTVGIFYNEDVTGPLTGWADFFAIPEKTGAKITILDDMREVLAVGLIMTGKSVNSTDPAEVQAVNAELQRPVDVEALVRMVPNGMEAQVYLASLSAIDLDQQAEAQYLHALAQALELTPEETNALHDRAGAPRLYR